MGFAGVGEDAPHARDEFGTLRGERPSRSFKDIERGQQVAAM